MLMENPKTAKRDPLKGMKTLKVNSFLEEFEVDDIKKRVDIVELFESFGVKLSGKNGNFMGLCPFHEDHTPSLSVDREQGLFNCFSGECKARGSVVDAVMNFRNTDFKGAMAYLKEFKSIGPGSPTGKPLKSLPVTEAAGAKEDLKPASGGLDFLNLKAIQKHYHEKLFEAQSALDYLKKRGFKTSELFERFQIGYSDGSLLSKLGEKQKEELKRVGILNEGILKEHFLNCLVFPILDDNQNLLSFYGRCIDDSSSFKHRYLKGPHKGVFNRKASKVYDEIILTECIIDALSLVESGLENVQALYGTNGFTDEHLQMLKDDNVKIVVLALDNDEAGKRAASSIQERLINEGFKVKIVSPFRGKDWNEALTAGVLNKDDLKALIEQAAIFEKEQKKDLLEPGLKVVQDGLNTLFTLTDIVYKVTGAKESFITSLRVNIKAEHQGEKYFDTLDLYSSRGRASFAGQISRLFGVEPKQIEKDLITILEYFESERDKKNKLAEEGEQKPVLTENDRRIGLEFLQSPDLFGQIIRDMDTLGYVGEDLNKQLLYLCASSRILDDPISVLIMSESASGKSMLVETVKKLIPPEDVIAVTSLSDQALNYIKDLMHKFLTLGEAVHSDQIEHQIREMLSGHELSRLVTVKDEKTGKMDTIKVHKETLVASVMSSTRQDINPENASRCFLVNTDESREQTRRIHDAQRKKYSLERHFEKEKAIPEIVRKHQSAQRLLKKLLIVNPFSKYLDFPDNLMRTRRDNDRFLDLIACVCFLRQYQKELKTEQGKEYIECDLEDYKVAHEIMVQGVLSSTMLEMPKGAYTLYEAIRETLREQSKKSGLKVNEIRFTQRDIREKSGFGQSWIKQNLRALVRFEYVLVVGGGGERTRSFYRLADDADIERIDLKSIPEQAEIKRLMEESGQKEE